MWVSKKRFLALEKRVSELESKQTVNTFTMGKVDLRAVALVLDDHLKKEPT